MFNFFRIFKKRENLTKSFELLEKKSVDTVAILLLNEKIKQKENELRELEKKNLKDEVFKKREELISLYRRSSKLQEKINNHNKELFDLDYEL